MPRSYTLYLNIIQTAMGRIERVARDLDEAAFQARELEADAILFNLLMIGEAASHLPPETREQMPEIDWDKLVRLRDLIPLHDVRIDMHDVWNTIHTDLPELKEQVDKLLALLEG